MLRVRHAGTQHPKGTPHSRARPPDRGYSNLSACGISIYLAAGSAFLLFSTAIPSEFFLPISRFAQMCTPQKKCTVYTFEQNVKLAEKTRMGRRSFLIETGWREGGE